MSVSTHGLATVVAVSGDIDIESAPALRDKLDSERVDGLGTLVLDLSEVAFLDSSALGAIVSAHRTYSEAGVALKIAGPRPHVQKIFSITRLAEVVPVFDTVDAACA